MSLNLIITGYCNPIRTEKASFQLRRPQDELISTADAKTGGGDGCGLTELPSPVLLPAAFTFSDNV